MRPECLVAIVGTHTEVGKTWAGRQLLQNWSTLGYRVAARKPVQSFEPGSGPTDAELLAGASGEAVHDVCPAHRWYACAMAPPMAAEVLHRPRIALADLVAEITWPDGTEVGLVETVGGVLSPLAHDASSLDLVRLLEPDDVVLVGDAGLGTINAIRLATAVLAPHRIHVLLNKYDPSSQLHRLNAEWLRQQDHLHVVLEPRALDICVGAQCASLILL